MHREHVLPRHDAGRVHVVVRLQHVAAPRLPHEPDQPLVRRELHVGLVAVLHPAVGADDGDGVRGVGGGHRVAADVDAVGARVLHVAGARYPPLDLAGRRRIALPGSSRGRGRALRHQRDAAGRVGRVVDAAGLGVDGHPRLPDLVVVGVDPVEQLVDRAPEDLGQLHQRLGLEGPVPVVLPVGDLRLRDVQPVGEGPLSGDAGRDAQPLDVLSERHAAQGNVWMLHV